MRHLPLLALATLLACSSGSGSGSGSSTKDKNPTTKAAPKPDLTIYLTAEMRGTIEPCGCTADPLGDLARTTQLVENTRAKGPVIFMDGGSTLYSQVKIPESMLAQEQLKSALIENTFTKTLQVAALGLGPYDFAEGPGKVRPPRQAANVKPDEGLALEAPKVITAGSVKVGVFGVVSPMALDGMGVEVGDPADAARKAIESLKGQGAQVIVALAHMTRNEASDLAKAAKGIDFMLVGQNAPEPTLVRPEPKKVRSTWLFRPANRGQTIIRLQLYRRGTGPFADAIGDIRAQSKVEHLEQTVAALEADLAKWADDPSADKAFVAGKKKELDEMKAERARLMASPLQVPDEGNYFTFGQIRIAKGLDCDEAVVEAKQAYDKAAGEANVKAAADKKPTSPEKGKPGYVGMEECAMCHKKAVDFWNGTHHAQAWKTLEDLGKQFDFDCIGCHVTGFEKPGGSNIAFNEPLRNVQCEVCHGPGSMHVEADGHDEPRTITAVPMVDTCKQCHTTDHSDTFEFDAYLRDITGPGHGDERRAALGDGPSGHELRSAALKKAGANIGARCPK